MGRSVSSYEAKTHLPRLLREVAAGASITITRHGTPVARLVPPVERPGLTTRDAIAALRELRRGKTLGDVSIRELIDEGRH